MAGKEATVYIVDLGRSMGEKRQGRSETNLEFAMKYVWDKITTTVATGRKTALMSVVGYRTDDTYLPAGLIEDEEGYDNIHVFSELKQWLLSDIRSLQEQIKPSATDDGDIFSALAVAVPIINNATTSKANGNKLKFDRRIIIVTDGQGQMDTTELEEISSKMMEDEIKVTLLGVDFDDAEFGFKEEDKDPDKENNEKALATFVGDCPDGQFGTIAYAVKQLEIPRIKEVKAIPNYKGTLTLGDAENYDATLTMDVERYPCTMVAKPPTASSFVVRTELGDEASGQSSGTLVADGQADGQLAAVRNQRAYKVSNPNEAGSKMSVEPEDLERGYEYGRTAVHISDSDSDVLRIETVPSLDQLGYIPQDKFERYLAMSRTNYILPQKGNLQSKLALSSFIHTLYESESYAVARLVSKSGKAPVMVLLVPRIEGDFEALMDVELPFEEDMRRYKFPPLDRKLTTSGKVITEHRDLPSEALMDAMSNYVDAMDLSTFGRDDEGEPSEYMPVQETYSPLLHRTNQVIKWRATSSSHEKIPDPPHILTKYSVPPAELVEKTEDELNALKAAGDVKKVPPKQKGRGKRRREDREKPLSGLDVDELLGNPKRVKVDPQNLIPSFKQALGATEDLDAIQSAVDEMGKNIKTLITASVGESGYGRALEAIRVMRDELTELEEPEIYNAFARGLKKDILDEKLNGDRREMWWKIRGSKYGLIDRKRSFASEVTEDEAAEFYRG